MPQIRVSPPATVDMTVTVPEAQLLLRLRQLRKADAVDAVLVTINPLAVSVSGRVEWMEKARVQVRRFEEPEQEQG